MELVTGRSGRLQRMVRRVRLGRDTCQHGSGSEGGAGSIGGIGPRGGADPNQLISLIDATAGAAVASVLTTARTNTITRRRIWDLPKPDFCLQSRLCGRTVSQLSQPEVRIRSNLPS